MNKAAFVAVVVAALATNAAAVAQAYPKSTYHAVRQDRIHLAADLARGACKYYASNATTSSASRRRSQPVKRIT